MSSMSHRLSRRWTRTGARRGASGAEGVARCWREEGGHDVLHGHYAENFAAKHAREKVFDILLKTQRKMSPRGRAVGLDFGFPTPILALYKQGLRVLEAAPAP